MNHKAILIPLLLLAACDAASDGSSTAGNNQKQLPVPKIAKPPHPQEKLLPKLRELKDPPPAAAPVPVKLPAADNTVGQTFFQIMDTDKRFAGYFSCLIKRRSAEWEAGIAKNPTISQEELGQILAAYTAGQIDVTSCR